MKTAKPSIPPLKLFLDKSADYLEQFDKPDLTADDYQKILSAYKKLSSFDERLEYLEKKRQKHGIGFDPEEILELCVDEILQDEPEGSPMRWVLQNTEMKWIQIVKHIEQTQYAAYGELMRPAIRFYGYAED